MADDTKHTWHFFRAGGVDQVRISSGADIASIGELDQNLWVALACPKKGLELDARTLEHIDTDQDGRIRAPEIVQAARWACSVLRDPEVLVEGRDSLALDAIDDGTPEGKKILASARHILDSLGKKEAETITVADTEDLEKIFAGSRFNGDGIVPAESVHDDETRRLILEIVESVGSVPDRGGKPGVDRELCARFFAQARELSDWHRLAEESKGETLPLGEGTAAAAAAVDAVKAKVDDYFVRCRLAAFDARAGAAVNRSEADYQAIAARVLAAGSEEIAAFPLAKVEAGRALPLRKGMNPAWADRVATFADAAVKPLLGDREALSYEDWTAIGARLAPFYAWQAKKAGASVEKLGIDRVREILAGDGEKAVEALIAKDLEKEPEATAIAQVDKLVRLNRDLLGLLKNFVSFSDFYGRKRKATFQSGTLYLDGRSCDLCVTVTDEGKHAALAGLAKTYLAYCDCTRPSGEKMKIAAAFTDGDSDNLMVGRNGVFYDRKGRDWDATITRVIDNPISLRQAFWAPYKKLIRMVEEQVAKRATAAEATSTGKLQATATSTVNADAAAAVTPAPPVAPKKLDVGLLAAIGLVLATLLAAFGAIVGAFAKMPAWQIPLAIAGIVLAISLPSVIIAWLKLRQRNMGPILDASGWAINARAIINVPFGGTLTKVATLPPGSRRSLDDPYAEKKPLWPWLLAILVALVLAVYLLNDRGCIHDWTGHGKRVSDTAGQTAPPSPGADRDPGAK